MHAKQKEDGRVNGYESNKGSKQQHYNEVSCLASKGALFQLATKSISLEDSSGIQVHFCSDMIYKLLHLTITERRKIQLFTYYILYLCFKKTRTWTNSTLQGQFAYIYANLTTKQFLNYTKERSSECEQTFIILEN